MPSRQVEELPDTNRFARGEVDADHEPRRDELNTPEGALHAAGNAGAAYVYNAAEHGPDALLRDLSGYMARVTGAGLKYLAGIGRSYADQMPDDRPEESEGVERIAGLLGSEFVSKESAVQRDQARVAALQTPDGMANVTQAPGERESDGVFDTGSAPSRRLASVKPRGKRYYHSMVNRVADAHGIDPMLLSEVASAESNYDQFAVGKAGEQGLMQLMPANLEALGVTDPFDAEQSLNAGAQMLSGLLGQYDGDIERALTAYNWGQGNMAKAGFENRPKSTRDYTSRVMGRVEKRHSESR